MMNKTGAAWIRIVAGVFMLGACATGRGEDGVVPEPQASASVDFKALAQTRANELVGQSFEDIEKAVLQSEIAMQKISEDAQAARMAVRELQEKMRLENPEVQAKYKEIDEMRAKINAFIDELPEVKAQLDVVKQTEAKLMEEIWFRSAAMGLAADQDRAAGFPERPETVLDETEAAPASEAKEDLEP